MATPDAPRPADDPTNPTDTDDEHAAVRRWITEHVGKAPPPSPPMIAIIVPVEAPRHDRVALGR